MQETMYVFMLRTHFFRPHMHCEARALTLTQVHSPPPAEAVDLRTFLARKLVHLRGNETSLSVPAGADAPQVVT